MTQAQLLASGLHFGEGPRWHDGVLWFSDFFDYAVKTVDLSGHIEVKFNLSDRPSGLGWLPDGRLLVVSMTARSVLRLEDRKLVLHADLSPLATFHCNDMVVDTKGRAYVGNFGFDLDTAEIDGTVGEVVAAHKGATLVRVDPDGSIHAAAEGLMFPNGTVITPDGRTLIVGESFGGRLTAFDVVETDNRCFACMLGGPDRRTLFMLTSQFSLEVEAAPRRTGNVLIAEVDTPGAGLP